MKLFLRWAGARHGFGFKPPSLHKAQPSAALSALGIAAALSVFPIQLPNGLNHIAGTTAVFAQETDPRILKKMERTVTRAQRKLGSVDRDITRMESDSSKIRSSQLDRTEEKISDITESLSDVEAGFEGLSDIQNALLTFTNRLDALKSVHEAGSPPVGTDTKASDESPADQRRLQSQISRVEKNIANAEKALERYLTEPSLTSARLEGVAKDRIASAKDKLSELMGIAPDVASGLEAGLTDIITRFEARAAEDASFASGRDAAAKKLEDMTASGAYEARLAEIKTIDEQSTQFEYLTWDSHLFLSLDNSAQAVDAAASWPDIVSTFEAYMRDNADIMALGGALPTLSSLLQRKLPNAVANLAKLADTLLPLYESKAQDIVTFSREIADEGSFNLFDLRTPDRKSVATEMIWLENWLAFYVALPNANSQTETALRAILSDTIATIDEIKEAGREKIIAQNSLDPDFYSSADREKILEIVEAGWRKIHKDTPINEIRIPSGQWSRTLGERWDKVNRMFVQIDFSTIDAYVVEEPENGIVTFWRVEVQQRHLEQNALISNPASRNRHAPKPNQQMLADNL